MQNLLRYAAILVGAVIFALSVTLISKGIVNESEVSYVERTNAKGQKAIIYLPDGSLVILNHSSKLIYPNKFSDDIRKVYLEGEAFFEVKKGNKPFIVEMNHIEAKVLGTSFNASAFPDKEEHSVSLVTGKVVVSPSEGEGDQGKLVLEPGDKAMMNGQAGTLVKAKFDYEQEIAWKEGVLILKKLPFKEALHRIEQWYGVEFTVDQMPDQDYLITGRFDNESLENVLKSIGFTVRFDHKIEEKKVYLNFKN